MTERPTDRERRTRHTELRLVSFEGHQAPQGAREPARDFVTLVVSRLRQRCRRGRGNDVATAYHALTQSFTGVDVERAVRDLSFEDIAIIEAFLVRPTLTLDDVQLAARTMLPLSEAKARASHLAAQGLLLKEIGSNGRALYSLKRSSRGRKKAKTFDR